MDVIIQNNSLYINITEKEKNKKYEKITLPISPGVSNRFFFYNGINVSFSEKIFYEQQSTCLRFIELIKNELRNNSFNYEIYLKKGTTELFNNVEKFAIVKIRSKANDLLVRLEIPSEIYLNENSNLCSLIGSLQIELLQSLEQDGT